MNEVFALLFLVVLDVALIYGAFCLGKEWVLATVIANLIIANIFGSELIPLFGVALNVGNIFYACVFLTTYGLIERYGIQTGLQALYMGAAGLIFFVVLSRVAIEITGVPLLVSEGSVLGPLSLVPRVFIASLLAYIFSQYLNIRLYEWLGRKTNVLWVRSGGANTISQLFDSSLFFSIAFFDVSGVMLVQGILVGWAIKIIVVLVGTPLLYLVRRRKE